MCGHYFSITPKSSFGRLNGESTLAKAPAAPPPDHHTPTHARVDSIMDVSSSYSAHDRAAAVKEVDEKHRHLNNSHHNNGFHTPINSPSRKSSYNSLDQSTMGKAPMARKPSKYQLYPRPRLSECRRPPSSPLANVGMICTLRGDPNIADKKQLCRKNQSSKLMASQATGLQQRVGTQILSPHTEVPSLRAPSHLEFQILKTKKAFVLSRTIAQIQDPSQRPIRPKEKTSPMFPHQPTLRWRYLLPTQSKQVTRPQLSLPTVRSRMHSLRCHKSFRALLLPKMYCQSRNGRGNTFEETRVLNLQGRSSMEDFNHKRSSAMGENSA